MTTNSRLTFEEWRKVVPPVRDEVDVLPKHVDIEDLCDALREIDTPIVMEGARYVGKTFTTRIVSERLVRHVLTAGKTIKERKQVMGIDRPDRATHKTGSADYEDFDLSVAQSHLWMLDTIRQLGISPILDRTLTSSMWFQHTVSLPHWFLWCQQMIDSGIVLVYLSAPSETIHWRRCEARKQDFHALRMETRGYVEMMRRVPDTVNLWPIAVENSVSPDSLTCE